MSLEKIQNKLKDCSLCTLRAHEINKGHVPSCGYGGNTIMVCDLFPVDNSEFLVVLKELDWPIDKTYFTTLLKCKCRNFDTVYADKCFNHWLSQEIIVVNPISIVTLGSIVEKFIGSRINYIQMFNAYHYRYVKNNEQLRPAWIKGLKSIIQTAKYNTKEMMSLY